ncbi:MAG: acyl carrier protein [bacterium]|nr:acyl carrier protein [bacterium]
MSSTQTKQLKKDIKQIIVEIVNKERENKITPEAIGDNEEIATSPVMAMDSIKAVKMIVDIEKKFDIDVPDEDLDLANFKSVTSIVDYLCNTAGVTP